MITCPRCSHRFPENTSSRQAFELFHALMNEYARVNGLNRVDAKDTLCVLYGVSVEFEGKEWTPPKWPGVFCRPTCYQGRVFFRKSTLAYTPKQMHDLIEATQEAVL